MTRWERLVHAGWRMARAEGTSLIDGAASGTFSEAQGVTIVRLMSRDEMVWPARRGTAVERAGCVPYEGAV